MIISKEQARKFLVIYHHLHKENPITTQEELLTYIKKVGCIQYDPINVLAYNSHLVLQSKVNNYRAEMLDELLYDRFELIDAWDKNLSIYHNADDQFFQRYRSRALKHYSELNEHVRQVIPSLRERMKTDGPTSSIDMKDSPLVKWSWAPTKAARAGLDYMFSNGETYVHHKVNTRKYYALIETHPHIQREHFDFESDESYHNWHIERRIGGVGLLPALKDTYAFIAIDGLTAAIRRATITRLLGLGRIKELHIEGIENPYYIRVSDIPLLEALSNYKEDTGTYKIIAALDNLIWDRDMIEELFDFRYRWEVYVPESKRDYGYYVLPILGGYAFIGRVVMKYNREDQQLVIYHLYFEDHIEQSDALILGLAHMFKSFYQFLGADGIQLIDGATNHQVIQQIIHLI